MTSSKKRTGSHGGSCSLCLLLHHRHLLLHNMGVLQQVVLNRFTLAWSIFLLVLDCPDTFMALLIDLSQT